MSEHKCPSCGHTWSDQSAPADKDAIGVVEHKGRRYKAVAVSNKFGESVKLTFSDGSKQFWVKIGDVKDGKTTQWVERYGGNEQPSKPRPKPPEFKLEAPAVDDDVPF